MTLKFHLAPPLLSKRDDDGHLVKRTYGPWMKHAFRWLAKFKRLRGTALDPFGKTAERRMERALIDEYTTSIGNALARLTPETLPLVLELAALPERMRGFGHVKERHLKAARPKWAALMAQWRGGAARPFGVRRPGGRGDLHGHLARDAGLAAGQRRPPRAAGDDGGLRRRGAPIRG